MDPESPPDTSVGQELPLRARVAVLEAVMRVADWRVIAPRLSAVLDDAMRQVDESTPPELRMKLEDLRVELMQAERLAR